MKTPEEKRLAKNAGAKKYYAANRKKIKERDKRYYEANKEKIKATIKRWRDANPEKHKAAVKKCREAKPRKYKAMQKAREKKWRDSNPDKISAKNHLRRARTMNSTIGATKTIQKWEKEWRSKKSAICYWCSFRVSAKICHMDHINPLAKGGAHSIENLCISCQPCNQRKNASDLQTWNSRIEQPVLF